MRCHVNEGEAAGLEEWQHEAALLMTEKGSLLIIN